MLLRCILQHCTRFNEWVSAQGPGEFKPFSILLNALLLNTHQGNCDGNTFFFFLAFTSHMTWCGMSGRRRRRILSSSAAVDQDLQAEMRKRNFQKPWQNITLQKTEVSNGGKKKRLCQSDDSSMTASVVVAVGNKPAKIGTTSCESRKQVFFLHITSLSGNVVILPSVSSKVSLEFCVNLRWIPNNSLVKLPTMTWLDSVIPLEAVEFFWFTSLFIVCLGFFFSILHRSSFKTLVVGNNLYKLMLRILDRINLDGSVWALRYPLLNILIRLSCICLTQLPTRNTKRVIKEIECLPWTRPRTTLAPLDLMFWDLMQVDRLCNILQTCVRTNLHVLP